MEERIKELEKKSDLLEQYVDFLKEHIVDLIEFTENATGKTYTISEELENRVIVPKNTHPITQMEGYK